MFDTTMLIEAIKTQCIRPSIIMTIFWSVLTLLFIILDFVAIRKFIDEIFHGWFLNFVSIILEAILLLKTGLAFVYTLPFAVLILYIVFGGSGGRGSRGGNNSSPSASSGGGENFIDIIKKM
ncbi:MAG: hypothetical protein ACM3UU_00980 [Ignavibacteriales bacterium]